MDEKDKIFFKLVTCALCVLFSHITFSSGLSDEKIAFLNSLKYSFKDHDASKEISAHSGNVWVGYIAYSAHIQKDDYLRNYDQSVEGVGLAKIDALFLLPEWRRKGVASRLLRLAIAHIKSIHNDKPVTICLEAIPIQDLDHRVRETIKLNDLIAFYQKHGAQVIEQNGISAVMKFLIQKK